MENEQIDAKMKELAKLINYEYYDIAHIKEAMHCQIVHDRSDGKNRKNYTNDSLAILGDSILKFILTEYLFDKGFDKGEITNRKKESEANSTLFDLCNKSGIFKFAYNDSYFSENAPPNRKVCHSKHDVYIEAIIAAIFKDKGFDYCKNWTINFFKQHNILPC